LSLSTYRIVYLTTSEGTENCELNAAELFAGHISKNVMECVVFYVTSFESRQHILAIQKIYKKDSFYCIYGKVLFSGLMASRVADMLEELVEDGRI
jgi:hypothetical protein